MSLLFRPNLSVVEALYHKASVKHMCDPEFDFERKQSAIEQYKQPKQPKPINRRPRKTWTQDDRNIAAELRAYGLTIDETSQLLDRSPSTIATFSQNYAGEIARRKQIIKQELINRLNLQGAHHDQ
jgi:hypothetical protein